MILHTYKLIIMGFGHFLNSLLVLELYLYIIFICIPQGVAGALETNSQWWSYSFSLLGSCSSLESSLKTTLRATHLLNQYVASHSPPDPSSWYSCPGSRSNEVRLSWQPPGKMTYLSNHKSQNKIYTCLQCYEN